LLNLSRAILVDCAFHSRAFLTHAFHVRVRCLAHSTLKEHHMVKVGLLVRLEAKPGKEADVEAFLKSGLALANQEPQTIVWFAIKMGPSTFGIFDAFPEDAGRKAHLGGPIAAALMAKAGELLATAPTIEMVDVLAAKIPG
jgi:quinol monooxygenase YgiN